MKRVFVCFVLALPLWLALASSASAGGLEDKLVDAVKKGNAGTVRTLLRQGADVNARDQEQWTPLHEAASNGQLEVAILLVEKGADVNARSRAQLTPLHSVASCGRFEGLSLPRGTLQKLARLLIENGADVNARGGDQWTPLHAALFRGQTVIATLLIEYGADVNARENINQWTPLHHAASGGVGIDVMRLLIEKGADVNARNNDSQVTPLHKAASRGWTEAAMLLIEKGADVNAKDKDQRTPLDEAAHYHHTEVAKLLAFDQGMVAARQQQWTTAIRYFEQAHKLSPIPEPSALILNLGLAESKIPGRELRAMAWFHLYLHQSPSAANAGAVRT